MEIDVETHGKTIPRIIKHIICVPPCPVGLIKELSLFKESMGLIDEPILSQVKRDSISLDSLSLPVTLWKYENEVMVNTATGSIHYVIRVWYEGIYQKFKYTFERAGLNEIWKLKRGEML